MPAHLHEKHWNGVSLGGWLLLEPGPASPLFERNTDPRHTHDVRCEWDLMTYMRQKKGREHAAAVIQKHRETHIAKRDFEQIRACGLNAVRLPFGYWVVLGATGREPYHGPGLEFIDRAVDWAEQCGLQIVLDLHGCPGGESGEAPCGRRRRPHGTWNWRQWRFDQSLEALQVVARRYHSRKCVTGIEVCNEPSGSVPSAKLCEYYYKAANLIREAGMIKSRVAIVLPIFQRPEDEFIQEWKEYSQGRHENVCFDVHCYHCFENDFNGKTLAEQFRHVELNAKWLRTSNFVVGEWSLALGCAAWSTCGNMEEKEVYKTFGGLQLEAYKSASHGRFFWNWTERDDCLEWNFQTACREGLLSTIPRLPRWNRNGEDPLEETLNPSPPEPCVLFGDTVYLRTFYGRYIDVDGCSVSARWPDKGEWQSFVFCPPAGQTVAAHQKIVTGQVVRLQNRAGRFLYVGSDGRVYASKRVSAAKSEFLLHVDEGKVLKHRGFVYLKGKATPNFVDADDEQDGLFTRYPDMGDWQRIAVEKMQENTVAAPPPTLAEKPVTITPKKRHRCTDPDAEPTSQPKRRRPNLPTQGPATVEEPQRAGEEHPADAAKKA
mmetsp:Transcript_21900/g.61188  ORF Transcript_21900/g.61188 Transcript_21900/m.61188 type:complete len:603 (-) Transcript_21900:213-2021(-)